MKIFIKFILLLTINVSGQSFDDFLNAIHRVETGGKIGFIYGKNGELGPLQITKPYWEDTNIGGKFEDCAKLDYSKKVVLAYMNKYEPKLVRLKNWEELARLHNSGPNWRKKKMFTDAYWDKVRKVLW
ncbi:MAG: hypothetical protein AABY22_25515 [Nanoarchaeota archaeon]